MTSRYSMICATCGPVSSLHLHMCPLPLHLETEQRPDLMQGTKYAQLARQADGSPAFTGVGYRVTYRTEDYARCGASNNHVAPSPDCQCGFWIPVHERSRLGSHSSSWVALEVEFGGTVLECAKDTPGPVWGYRAQWQRVLSVTLHPLCSFSQAVYDWSRARVTPSIPPCDNLAVTLGAFRPNPWPPTYSSAPTELVYGVCENHAGWDACTVIDRPVTWLREGLRTEVRPANLRDDWTAVVREPKLAAPVITVTEGPGDPRYAYMLYGHPVRRSYRRTWTMAPGQSGAGLDEAMAASSMLAVMDFHSPESPLVPGTTVTIRGSVNGHEWTYAKDGDTRAVTVTETWDELH